MLKKEARRYTPSGDSVATTTQYRNLLFGVVIEASECLSFSKFSKLDRILKLCSRTPTKNKPYLS